MAQELFRKLSIGKNSELIQQPSQETKILRSGHGELIDKKISGNRLLRQLTGSELEIKCQINLGDAKRTGLTVLCDDEGRHGGLSIYHDSDGVYVGDTIFMMMRREKGEVINLHLFVDRTVVEVFLDGGRYSVTRVHEKWTGGEHVYAYAEKGVASFTINWWSLNLQ